MAERVHEWVRGICELPPYAVHSAYRISEHPNDHGIKGCSLRRICCLQLILEASSQAQSNGSAAASSHAQSADAAKAKGGNSSLADLSIEELMSVNVEVNSAAKESEQLSQAAAAIFVLTAEDIRRGGFSSIPEVLRMVPGLYVASVN